MSLNAQTDLLLFFGGGGVSYVAPDNNNAVTDVGTEADATTGWAGTGTSTFESQEVTVNVGTSALYAVASANVGRMYCEIHDEYNLTEGLVYTITFDLRHDGTATGDGEWRVELGANSANAAGGTIVTITKTDITFISYSKEFTHSSDTHFLVARERNAEDDGGVYLDNVAIR